MPNSGHLFPVLMCTNLLTKPVNIEKSVAQIIITFDYNSLS